MRTMSIGRAPTRSAACPNGTPAATPTPPAIVKPRPTWVTESPTMRVKYSALSVMYKPLPNVFTNVIAASRRNAPSAGTSFVTRTITRRRVAANQRFRILLNDRDASARGGPGGDELRDLADPGNCLQSLGVAPPGQAADPPAQADVPAGHMAQPGHRDLGRAGGAEDDVPPGLPDAARRRPDGRFRGGTRAGTGHAAAAGACRHLPHLRRHSAARRVARSPVGGPASHHRRTRRVLGGVPAAVVAAHPRGLRGRHRLSIAAVGGQRRGRVVP